MKTRAAELGIRVLGAPLGLVDKNLYGLIPVNQFVGYRKDKLYKNAWFPRSLLLHTTPNALYYCMYIMETLNSYYFQFLHEGIMKNGCN